MAQFLISWTPTAELSLYEILNFYIEQNGNNDFSKLLLSEIILSVNILSQYPYAGKQTNIRGFRELVLERNSVFYQTHEQSIEILLVWDNRRNPQELYKKLKKV